MTTRERILALRLFEKQERNLTYMKALGISVSVEQRSGGKPEKAENPSKGNKRGNENEGA